MLKGRPFEAVIPHPHLETLVGRDDGSFVVDWRDVDMDNAGQTVLPDFRLIGHNYEAVLLSFAAIVNVGDVLSFHLETKNKKQMPLPEGLGADKRGEHRLHVLILTSVCVNAVMGIPGIRLCSRCPYRGGTVTWYRKFIPEK